MVNVIASRKPLTIKKLKPAVNVCCLLPLAARFSDWGPGRLGEEEEKEEKEEEKEKEEEELGKEAAAQRRPSPGGI